MITAFVIFQIVTTLIWLFCIRPYCRSNGKGYAPGFNSGVTILFDWQQARVIEKAKGDHGIIMTCRIIFLLNVAFLAVLAYCLISRNPN